MFLLNCEELKSNLANSITKDIMIINELFWQHKKLLIHFD